MCPKCGKPAAHRLISAGTNFILKGGGWYSDLYSSSNGKAKKRSSKSATQLRRHVRRTRAQPAARRRPRPSRARRPRPHAGLDPHLELNARAASLSRRWSRSPTPVARASDQPSPRRHRKRGSRASPSVGPSRGRGARRRRRAGVPVAVRRRAARSRRPARGRPRGNGSDGELSHEELVGPRSSTCLRPPEPALGDERPAQPARGTAPPPPSRARPRGLLQGRLRAPRSGDGYRRARGRRSRAAPRGTGAPAAPCAGARRGSRRRRPSSWARRIESISRVLGAQLLERRRRVSRPTRYAEQGDVTGRGRGAKFHRVAEGKRERRTSCARRSRKLDAQLLVALDKRARAARRLGRAARATRPRLCPLDRPRRHPRARAHGRAATCRRRRCARSSARSSRRASRSSCRSRWRSSAPRAARATRPSRGRFGARLEPGRRRDDGRRARRGVAQARGVRRRPLRDGDRGPRAVDASWR